MAGTISGGTKYDIDRELVGSARCITVLVVRYYAFVRDEEGLIVVNIM